MRALKVAGAVAACLIVAIALLLMVGLPSGVITTIVRDRISRATGYQIAINGSTDLGFWPSPNLTLRNVTLDDPKHPAGIHLKIGALRGSFTLSGLLSGHPQVSEVVIDHPTLRLPMSRDRGDSPNGSSGSATREGGRPVALPIAHVRISNGTLVFFDAVNRVENRMGDIDAEAAFTAERQVTITGRSDLDGHSLKFALKTTVPATVSATQNIPVDLKLDAPDLLSRRLSARADVRMNGTTLLINGISGLLGDGQFNGWASVNLAGKPLVKLDLDIQKLDIATTPASSATSPQSALQPWSDAPIDLTGLNYIDAEIRLSADEFTVGKAQFLPAAVDATIDSGHLKASFSRLGVYDGQINGEVAIDASGATPAYTLTGDINGVRALPLLSGLFNFDNLDGKMQAKLALQSSGGNLGTIVSNLGGTASVDLRDGAIHNLNVATMIRALTSETLAGWQEHPGQTTDLTQLGASFQIAQGKATTGDLVLIGPLVRMTGGGTVDFGAKSLAFRVEPKLVMTTQGQGSDADAVGLGIPVVIQGAWNDPRIYPDISGILDNPEAAYAKLRDMGQGLFGVGGAGATGQPGSLSETLGTLIQQGLGGAATNAPTPGGKPAPNQPSPLNGLMKQLFGR